MSGDPLRDVSPGEAPGRLLNASTFNLQMAAARWFRDNAAANGRRFGTPGAIAPDEIPGRLEVRVRASSTLPHFAVINLGTALIDPDTVPVKAFNTPVFNVVAPVAGGVLAILSQPLAGGVIGRAVVSGVAVCTVVVSNAAHRYARPVVGDTTALESADSGPAYLLTPPGVGTFKTLVLLAPPQPEPPEGVTVEEADGTPQYTGATTLRFDQADGFVVTEPAAGTVRVDLAAATAAQAGVVSTAAQTFGGEKLFVDDATFQADVYVQGSNGVSARLATVSDVYPLTNPYLGITLDPSTLAVYATGPRLNFHAGNSGTDRNDIRFDLNPDFNPSNASARPVLEAWGTDETGVRTDVTIAARGGFAVGDHASGYTLGVTGFLGPGAAASAGIVTSAGSGTFVGTASANTFTANNTFAPSSDVVPVTIRGSAAQTANLLTVEQNGGTDVFTVDADGDVAATSFSGAGSGLTGLNASELASGTIPAARIGTVDGGTW